MPLKQEEKFYNLIRCDLVDDILSDKFYAKEKQVPRYPANRDMIACLKNETFCKNEKSRVKIKDHW